MYNYVFAGPLAQGVIEGSCSLFLFVYPPLSPQGLSASAFGRLGPAWAPPIVGRGSLSF